MTPAPSANPDTVGGGGLKPSKECRSTSAPFMSLSTSASRGRHLLAVRDFQPGELIASARPFALVPDAANFRNVCAGCVRPPVAPALELPVVCTGACGRAWYCSFACRERDWAAGHSAECRALREFFGRLRSPGMTPLLDEAAWLLVRATTRLVDPGVGGVGEDRVADRRVTGEQLWQLCENAEHVDRTRLLGVFGRLAICLARHAIALRDLALHGSGWPDRLMLPKCEVVILQDVAMELVVSAGQPLGGTDPDSALGHALLESIVQDCGGKESATQLLASCLALVCKEESNSYGLYTYGLAGPTAPRQGYAIGLYSDASYFNHSCAPNVVHAVREAQAGAQAMIAGATTAPDAANHDGGCSEPGEFRFFAVDEIAAGDELCISYVGVGEQQGDAARRRRILRKVFHFECSCELCTAEVTSGGGDSGVDKTRLARRLDRLLCSRAAAAAAAATLTRTVRLSGGRAATAGCLGYLVPRQLVVGSSVDNGN
ncbi:hypothetical protein HK405_004937, partial [Cladochytrium tenue]